MALPTAEKTLLAFDPISRIVPTTTARITASMTAYSAMSCPASSRKLRKTLIMLTSLTSETEINPMTTDRELHKDSRFRYAMFCSLMLMQGIT